MSQPRHSFGPQPGRLVATMLRALTAELSDPGRYSRAKGYARDGAVIEIDVQPEVISGLVLGSRREPYEVLLAVDPVPPDEIERVDLASVGSMTMLIPGRDELSMSCSCPDADGGQLCKHALALMLVMADETSIEPELLVRWRTSASGSDRRRHDTLRLAPRGRTLSERIHQDLGRRLAPSGRQSAVPSPPSAPVRRIDPLAGLLDASAPLPTLPHVARRTAPTPAARVLNDPGARLLHDLVTSALETLTR